MKFSRFYNCKKEWFLRKLFAEIRYAKRKILYFVNWHRAMHLESVKLTLNWHSWDNLCCLKMFFFVDINLAEHLFLLTYFANLEWRGFQFAKTMPNFWTPNSISVSFFNLEIVENSNFSFLPNKLRKLFKGGNFLRKYGIQKTHFWTFILMTNLS